MRAYLAAEAGDRRAYDYFGGGHRAADGAANGLHARYRHRADAQRAGRFDLQQPEHDVGAGVAAAHEGAQQTDERRRQREERARHPRDALRQQDRHACVRHDDGHRDHGEDAQRRGAALGVRESYRARNEPPAPSLRCHVHRCAHRRRDENERRGVCQQPDGRVVVGGGDGEALSRREAGVVEGEPQAADGLIHRTHLRAEAEGGSGRSRA